jgi:hypothetical protein
LIVDILSVSDGYKGLNTYVKGRMGEGMKVNARSERHLSLEFGQPALVDAEDVSAAAHLALNGEEFPARPQRTHPELQVGVKGDYRAGYRLLQAEAWSLVDVGDYYGGNVSRPSRFL